MKGEFRRSVPWALIAGLLMVVGSGVALWLYSTWRSIDPLDTVAVNFAAVFLSIGAVTLVYDIFLRGQFASDLLDLVQLKHSLAEAGLEDISTETAVPWHEILDVATRFRFLLVDPSAWIERDWNVVLGAGRKREIHVHVYLPDPDGPLFDSLARHVGLDMATYKSTIDRAVQQVELSWKNARDTAPHLIQGSSVDVVLIRDFPAYSLAILDERAVLLLGGSLGRNPGEAAVALRFRMRQKEFPWTWLTDQVRVIEDRNYPAIYSNVA